MKITSLYQLDSGNLSIEPMYSYDLTPETMAMLTEYQQTQLEGFFGAPTSSVGSLSIYHDDDVSWLDVAECMDGSHEAIIPIQWDYRWLVDNKVDETDKAIEKIIDAYRELQARHGWSKFGWDFHDEDAVPFKTLDRYAQRLGYMVNRHDLIGTGRGDELSVLHITRLDRLFETSVLYHEVAPYWEGNCYTVHVRLESPFKGDEDFNEMLGHLIGRDRYILDTASEMITDAIVSLTGRTR